MEGAAGSGQEGVVVCFVPPRLFARIRVWCGEQKVTFVLN